MSPVPDGWQSASLGEVCRIVSGSTPKTGRPAYWGGDIAWVTPNDLSRDRSQVIQGGERTLTAEGYESCSARLFPPGSVIVTSRAPIGYVAIAGAEMCTNQGCKTAVPPEFIDSRYLYWFLVNARPDLESRASGTTFKEISGRRFAETEFWWPDLEEQRRIVEILEDHLSRLDSGLSLTEGALRRTGRWLEAIVDQAVTTGDWPSAAVRELASVGSGATPLRSRREYYDGGRIPWVTSGALNEPFVREPSGFITERALNETAVKMWPTGTLLVAMYGEGRTRGQCSELTFPSTTNQACAAIVLMPEHEHLRPWVKIVLRSRYQRMRSMASGGVQPNLSLGLIRHMQIPIAPRHVRASVTHRLAEADAGAARLQLATRRAIERSDVLRRALLQAAFTGRLTGRASDETVTQELAGV